MAEWIYGKNTVMTTLESNHKVLEVYLLDQLFRDKKIQTLLKQKQIPYKIVDRSKLNQLVKGNHQGMVAKIEDYQYYTIDDILLEAERKNENPFIVILDGLEDPHNLGAILRTAEAGGVHGIIIPKHRSVGLNATVAKLSTGAIEYMKVARVTNINQAIQMLKQNGVWVIGADLATNLNYTDMDYTVPTALIIGNEGKGISRLVKENCDALIKIPMFGQVQSLNASVSAGILMYEVIRQRRGK